MPITGKQKELYSYILFTSNRKKYMKAEGYLEKAREFEELLKRYKLKYNKIKMWC